MPTCCFSALPQDELYLQHLADACQDAVRRFLGPRWALQHARHVPCNQQWPCSPACLFCPLACLYNCRVPAIGWLFTCWPVL